MKRLLAVSAVAFLFLGAEKDQKVDFEFVQKGKDYMVTGVK